MMKRNIGKHTSSEEAKTNILRRMSQSPECGFPKSTLGKIAFPGYDFKTPQGAAFAAAKIVNELDGDGIVRLADDHCWYITRNGLVLSEDLK